MLTLVTVIYGDAQRYRVELFGSVLSILKLRQDPETRIVVYTDRELEGFPLPVQQRIISRQEWQEWTRGSGLTHLVKLHLLRQTVENSGGPVIYFDTDTLFQVAPEQLAARLSPNSSLMHAAEGAISGHEIWSSIAAWLGPGRNVCGVTLSRNSVMYNSGVVGVVPAHAPALERSVAIADTLSEVDPIFSLDQFSTGSALGHVTQISSCEAEVLHYWGWNRAFIRDEIEKIWRGQDGKSLDEWRVSLDPAHYVDFPRIELSDKLHARYLEFRHGLNADSRFACIALLAAMRCGDRDTGNANLWFDVHVNFAMKPPRGSDAALRLYQAVGDRYTKCRGWLNKSNTTALATLSPQ